MKIHIGFANIGRANNADQVRTALRTIHDRLDGYDLPKVLNLNEIDEGDTTNPDDHTLVGQEFGDNWAKPHPPWKSREPILARHVTITHSNKHAGCPGMSGQTPARDLWEVRVDGEDGPDVVVLNAHYPAGAHNGDRPPDVKDELLDLYAELKQVHVGRIRNAMDNGRHVLWAMDTNWPDMPLLHDREKTLSHGGPDWIRVVPAPGWKAEKTGGGTASLPIDGHDYRFATVKFNPA
jgi:hypothetical protein